MSTCYVTNRHNNPVTRAQVLAAFEKCFISDDDALAGKTLHTTSLVGVLIGDDYDYVWIGINSDDIVDSAITYGHHSSSVALDSVVDVIGELISEHHPDFPYHEFFVDVKTATPSLTLYGYEIHAHDGYVSVYYRPQNIFFPMCTKRDEGSFMQYQQMILQCREEFEAE